MRSTKRTPQLSQGQNPSGTRTAGSGEGDRPATRRRWWMRLLAATAIPVLILGLLEVGLRVAGYGYPTTYFRSSTIDGQRFLIPNYKFSYRFFPPALARKPVLQRMAADKPAGTYRIFLFGESAAFGDPDPSFGVGRYLEALLEQRYPEPDFEVMCVAMTAINSHAILPIARECARYDGDLWIIYMGNNEMVGPYGAGTVFGTKAPRRGMVRAILALKTTRVGQLLDALATGLRSESSVPQTWTGIDMFSKNPLRHDDPARLRAYENFRGNLNDIIDVGLKANVPILLSTVASNLKDCSPFASLHAAGLEAPEIADWDKLYQEAVALENAGDYPAALTAYSNAAAVDSEFAELQFRMGTCHLALSNRAEALQAFEKARDHDVLAVRADTRINRILREAAGQHGDDPVRLADPVTQLADEAGGGIAGEEWFYEHVHFTLEGNYRLARVLANELAALLPPAVTANGGECWAEAEACDRRLAATLFDQQRLWREVSKRISVPPFTSQTSHAANLRYVGERLQEVLSQLTPETSKQDRVLYEEALAHAPEDNLLRGNFAQFLDATGSRSESIAQGKRVCELLPDLSWPYYYVGALLVQEGRIAEAADYFETALKIRSDFVQARNALQRIQLIYPYAVGTTR